MKKQITFNGIDYPTRKLYADGEEATISTLNLYDALHPNEWGTENDGFASKEAEEIDNGIFTYVDEDEINLPFDDLKKVLEESNPDITFTEQCPTEKIYVVIKDERWDGETWDRVLGAYWNEDDAVARVKEEADKVRPDWVNESVEETERSFYAWRDGEYDLYHCEIYVEQTELI